MRISRPREMLIAVDHHVPDFASGQIRAPEHPPVYEDPRANARAYVNIDRGAVAEVLGPQQVKDKRRRACMAGSDWRQLATA